MGSAPGRGLVRLYYRLSPPMAGLISGNDTLKTCARLMIAPVALAAAIGWQPCLGLLLLIVSLLLNMRVAGWKRMQV